MMRKFNAEIAIAIAIAGGAGFGAASYRAFSASVEY